MRTYKARSRRPWRRAYLDEANMKAFARLFAYVLSAQLVTSAVSAYEVPPGSVGFYHGNSSAAVTFDQHSMFLDGKRLYIFSGEIHVWRAPTGPALWRDLFQKFKVSHFSALLRSESDEFVEHRLRA